MALELQPITLKEALVFVERHHRHHDAPQGGLFAVAVNAHVPPRSFPEWGGHVPGLPVTEWPREVVGVAIIGRPVAKARQDGYTAEVTRVCVLEHNPNACSMLYAASWRAARALGYRRLGTYLLKDEPATSVKAAGWRFVGMTEDAKRGWTRPNRPRVDTHPIEQKQIWEAV